MCRLKVDTLPQAVVVPTSAVQRGPAGTFSYVIGDGDIVTAKPVVVTQQNETDAVIASGLSASDRVVTTGFANLSEGAKVIVGKDDQHADADLAPRKKEPQPSQGRSGQGWLGQGRSGQGRRAARQAGVKANRRARPAGAGRRSAGLVRRSRSHDRQLRRLTPVEAVSTHHERL